MTLSISLRTLSREDLLHSDLQEMERVVYCIDQIIDLAIEVAGGSLYVRILSGHRTGKGELPLQLLGSCLALGECLSELSGLAPEPTDLAPQGGVAIYEVGSSELYALESITLGLPMIR